MPATIAPNEPAGTADNIAKVSIAVSSAVQPGAEPLARFLRAIAAKYLPLNLADG
jgi:hypothetical protein